MFEKIILISFTVLFGAASWFSWLFIIPTALFSAGVLFLVWHSLTSPDSALEKRLETLEQTVRRLSAAKSFAR